MFNEIGGHVHFQFNLHEHIFFQVETAGSWSMWNKQHAGLSNILLANIR